MSWIAVRFVEDWIVHGIPKSRCTSQSNNMVMAPFGKIKYPAWVLLQGTKEEIVKFVQDCTACDDALGIILAEKKEKMVQTDSLPPAIKELVPQVTNDQETLIIKSPNNEHATVNKIIKEENNEVEMEKEETSNDQQTNSEQTTVNHINDINKDEKMIQTEVTTKDQETQTTERGYLKYTSKLEVENVFRTNILRYSSNEELNLEPILPPLDINESSFDEEENIKSKSNDDDTLPAITINKIDKKDTKHHLEQTFTSDTQKKIRSRRRLFVPSSSDEEQTIQSKRNYKRTVTFDAQPMKPVQARRMSIVQSSSDEEQTILSKRNDKRTVTFDAQPMKPVQARRKSIEQSSSDEEETIQSKTNDDKIPKKDKKHACFYCGLLLVKMARHLTRIHNNEQKVQEMIATTIKSTKLENLNNLVKVGDYNHNLEVITKKCGLLIVSRGMIPVIEASDYGPCPECLVFLKKKNIWRHAKNCTNNVDGEIHLNKRRYISESSALITSYLNPELNESFLKKVVFSLRSDELGNVARSDNLIMKFGLDLFENLGSIQSEMIRQNMRQLARLVISMKTGDIVPKLEELINPQNVEILINSIRQLCLEERNEDHVKPTFKIPSLAIKLGYHIRNCSHLLRGMAISQFNYVKAKLIKSFLFLWDVKYSKKISSNALSTLRTKKINTSDCLPHTGDLISIRDYVVETVRKLTIQFEKEKTCQLWYELSHFVLCRIILFNKRRGGEMSRMKVDNYLKKRDWKAANTTEDISKAMTPLEIKIAESMYLIEIMGKKGRVVPVLLTRDVHEAMDLLYKNRLAVGVSATNTFFFARPNLNSQNCIRGPDALAKIIKDYPKKLERPDLITSTKLRKYTATVCQLLELKENETDWLARHLGHDITVQRQFYRLDHSAIEMTKISRLLLAVEEGTIHQFSGKTLNEIQVEDLPPISISEDEEDDKPPSTRPKDISTAVLDEEEEWFYNVDEDERSEETKSTKAKERNLKKKSVAIKRPWSTPQKSFLLDFFRSPIKYGIVPRKDAIIQCINLKPQLFSTRNWRDLKTWTHNYIESRKKKIKK